ncbi:unnamed protein product [Miscanthus lutarioriparius]|uniref:Leucine-rich repeat extensin-like protein 3 n=1 Tax=Miscanthus lutarioriparius TaxID=422564 RepID=A0A811ME05_9POAL|nr:unnamed protein product [Miscanthus lutarioriparius]
MARTELGCCSRLPTAEYMCPKEDADRWSGWARRRNQGAMDGHGYESEWAERRKIRVGGRSENLAATVWSPLLCLVGEGLERERFMSGQDGWRMEKKACAMKKAWSLGRSQGKRDGAAVIYFAGLDLNHGDIAGYLPPELGLLADLSLLHLNFNRFCGLVPATLRRLRLLVELDLSNNRLVGAFPAVVLDLRFNDFEGAIPPALFDRPLDAIFLNHNRLRSPLPDNFGNSPASVIVLADNSFGGCLPASLGNMSGTLNEILFINNGLDSCVPPEVGLLREVTVFDVSFNALVGPLPQQVAGMRKVEQLDVAHNRLSGAVPEAICALPRLKNLTISYNFFTGEPPSCARVVPSDGDRRNCLPSRPAQRTPQQCAAFYSQPPVDCAAFQCKPFVPVPPPPPPPSYPGPLPPVYPMPYASPPPPAHYR